MYSSRSESRIRHVAPDATFYFLIQLMNKKCRKQVKRTTCSGKKPTCSGEAMPFHVSAVCKQLGLLP